MSRYPLQFQFRMEMIMDYHLAKEQSGMEDKGKKSQGTNNLNKFKDKTQTGFLQVRIGTVNMIENFSSLF